VAVAEVSGQGTWQRSAVGIAVVGNEGRHVQSMLDKIQGFVEQLYVAQVLNAETELITYGDDEPLELPGGFE